MPDTYWVQAGSVASPWSAGRGVPALDVEDDGARTSRMHVSRSDLATRRPQFPGLSSENGRGLEDTKERGFRCHPPNAVFAQPPAMLRLQGARACDGRAQVGSPSPEAPSSDARGTTGRTDL